MTPRRPRRCRVFFLTGAIVLSVMTQAGAKPLDVQIKKKRGALEKIQDRIESKEAERQQTIREEELLRHSVDDTSVKLRRSRAVVRQLEEKISSADRKRQSLEQQLWSSRMDLEQWIGLLTAELREYYERSALSLSDASAELLYREAALADKTQGLAFAQQQHSHVETVRDDLLSLEIQLQKLRLSKEAEKSQLHVIRQQMKDLHATVRGRKAVLEKELSDLKASAKQLASLISDLQKKQEMSLPSKQVIKAAQAVHQQKRGHLPWPVDGEVSQRFGKTHHPELDTYIFSNGITIRTPAPSSVRAVEKGIVLYTGEFMSYGNMILLDHGGRLYSVYGQLGEILVSKGQPVSTGEILGQTGLDDDEKSMIYFELRISGDAVDPLVWLK
ncbi:MAG TPA: peptidoglycan DD-metalloendopeptidase family protein [Elusimicrobiota bacterium]|nr:peptidoglycan DD-metalloendopeptidase family protein [Elusimicrobiota bacterium]